MLRCGLSYWEPMRDSHNFYGHSHNSWVTERPLSPYGRVLRLPKSIYNGTGFSGGFSYYNGVLTKPSNWNVKKQEPTHSNTDCLVFKNLFILVMGIYVWKRLYSSWLSTWYIAGFPRLRSKVVVNLVWAFRKIIQLGLGLTFNWYLKLHTVN